MNADTDILNRISHRTIGCAYTVANTLGCGFLEKVHENALAHKLRKAGLAVEQQRSMTVWYDEIAVGDYTADLLVEKAVIVGLRAVRALDEVHRAQCMNYLRASNLHLCLLLDFSLPRLEVRRLIWHL